MFLKLDGKVTYIFMLLVGLAILVVSATDFKGMWGGVILGVVIIGATILRWKTQKK